MTERGELTNEKKAELRRIAELTFEATLAADAKLTKLAERRAKKSLARR